MNSQVTQVVKPRLVEYRQVFGRLVKARQFARFVSSKPEVPWVKVFIHAGECTVIWLAPESEA